MSPPRQILRHIEAMRVAAEAMDGGESVTSFELGAQRIKASLENLTLLTLKTPRVGDAAAAVRAAMPQRADDTWSLDILVLAINDFEAALDASGPSRVAQSIGAWPPPLQGA